LERSGDELTALASTLARVPEELRDKCIKFARARSPTAACNLAAKTAALYGCDPMECLAVGRATRWLAMIRRDHGKEAFEEAARTLTSHVHA